jgi:hypothetical protein
LNIAQIFALVGFVAKTNGFSAGSCATGSSNSMDIGLWYIGQLEVDDMAEFIHINSSRGDVSSHQNPYFPFFKSIHRPIPLRLAFVAMDGFGLYSGSGQVLGNFICTVFCSGKDES